MWNEKDWRYLRTPALVVLLATSGGCASNRPLEDDWSIAAAPAPERVARVHSSEHTAFPRNAFPSSRGPVPRLRGQDHRPADTRAPAGAPRGLTHHEGIAADRFRSSSAGATTAADPSTLVLYDESGEWGWLGELYAAAAGTLASHFGTWSAMPAVSYTAGAMARYTAVVYIGSSYGEALPVALLDDVLAAKTPVVWIYDNIWELANRAASFTATYGYDPYVFDTSTITQVVYKEKTLGRSADNTSGIMSYSALDTDTATVLASAVHADGTTIPWALRSHNLTYVGEIPFDYILEGDRYLAFCDLLFDVLSPSAPELHRALVRIEDVNSSDDPASLTAVADYLYSLKIPFSIATIPDYVDPLGAYNDGVPQTIPLAQAPTVVSAIKYMVARGGSVHMHGYTHQYSDVLNPYTGVSADDFEFWMGHIDATTNSVVQDGPVPVDTTTWTTSRITQGLADLAAAGLPAPFAWEFPHYAGSAVDSRAIQKFFAKSYQRPLFFGGALTGGPDNLTHEIGMFYPYKIHDVYGFENIPEDLGSYEPLPANNNPAWLVSDILNASNLNLVVRDGIGSFYFHAYYPLTDLQQIVEGLLAQGYTFVAADTL